MCLEPPNVKKEGQRVCTWCCAGGKRRTFSSSTRCGCPFQLTFRLLQKKDKTNKSIVLTGSCIYDHGNGCFASCDHLEIARKKSGVHTRAVKEQNFQAIQAIISANQKVPVPLLRDMVRPLFPHGHALEAKFLLCFRSKAQKMLGKKV
jgi:hypothetical protein